MSNKLKSNPELSKLLQSKLSFNLLEIEDKDYKTLKTFKEQVKKLGDNNHEFFNFFYTQNNSVKVYLFDKLEADNIFNDTNFRDVIGKLDNGWLLGRDNVHFYFGSYNIDNFSVSYEGMANVEWVEVDKLFSTVCSFKNYNGYHVGISCDLMDSYKFFFKDLFKVKEIWQNEIDSIRQKINDKIKTKVANNLAHAKVNHLNILDSDNDGNVDLVENDFNKLLSKNQKKIIEIDKNYVHQFVKVSNFIKIKKTNTQKIFETIRDSSNQSELEERVNLLNNQIHSYELLMYHSINMIGALVSEDLITFYEIYESFDKLAIFNSNWENEVSEKLIDIGDKLDDLLYSIYKMERNIVNEFSQLTYITQKSFEGLNRSVINQLKEVESSINFNNLLTSIQTYQLYNIKEKISKFRKLN